MDRSADKSSKNETALKFERGPQSSHFDEKDDNGAYVSFDKVGSIERLLRIKFGYESSGYEYSRDIFLDFEKVVELKKHIDSMIEHEAKQQKSFYVFSYGPNMLYSRISNRCSSVEVVDKLCIPGFKLNFNKMSRDDSGKANITKTDNKDDFMWGIIHRISWNDKPQLDKTEDLDYGYDLVSLNKLSITTNFNHHIKSYISTDKKYHTKKKPYDWYMKLVIKGAEENDFPDEYINKLKNTESKPDKDKKRKLKELSVLPGNYALEYYEKYDKYE